MSRLSMTVTLLITTHEPLSSKLLQTDKGQGAERDAILVADRLASVHFWVYCLGLRV